VIFGKPALWQPGSTFLCSLVTYRDFVATPIEQKNNEQTPHDRRAVAVQDR
jgi:hypothetical protein